MYYYSNISGGRNSAIMVNRLLKGKEVAHFLNVSKAFAYRLMAERRIPTIKMGRSVRVRPEDLEQFVTESIVERNG